jgi:hypothetical protein
MNVKSALESIKPDEKLIQDTEKLLRSNISKKKLSLHKFIAAAACMTIMIGTLSISLYVYNQPVSYISFDVNPSLELEINRFDRVVDVNYFNDDAKNLVSEKKLHFLKPGEAINLIMKEVDKKGYLPSSQRSIIAIAANSNKADKSAELLDECIKHVDNCAKPINVISYTASESIKEEADSFSLSFGKLKLIKVIQQLDKSAAVEDFKDASLSSIMNEINYLTSGEYKDADDNTKKRIKSYINSIQTKIDAGIETNNQADTKVQADTTDGTKESPSDTEATVEQAVAAQDTAEAEKAKAEAEAAAKQAAAEEEKAKAEADAVADQAAAEKAKAKVDTAAEQAAAEEEKAKAEADAAAEQAADEEEKAKAEADAAAAKAAAEEEKERAEADAAAVKAAAEAEKEKAEADAAAAQAAAEAEKAKAEADAAAAQTAAEAEKAKAEADAAAAQTAAEAEKTKAEADAAAAQAAAEAE